MESTVERGLETNTVELTGEIIEPLKYSHKTYGEAFYQTVLGVRRKSGYEDEVVLTVSERLLWDYNVQRGDCVDVLGQIRTYNEECQGRSRLNIIVFVREIKPTAQQEFHRNYVSLEGYICKAPIRRTSPLGREICDIMLAVNRMYNKSDYIPCIAWGRNAAYAGSLDIGTKLNITGRIQSRAYKKRLDDGAVMDKTAYEVSILKIDE